MFRKTKLLCFFLSCLFGVFPKILFAQSVGIGTVQPAPSARLDISDTIRGLLIPRLTTAQRNAIVNPAHTLMIFNIDSFCLEVYDTVTRRWYTISCPRNCVRPACNFAVSGPAYACAGDTVMFEIQGCPESISWQWSFSPSWTIIQGQGTRSVQVRVDTGSVNEFSVQACNACGCGVQQKYAVQVQTCQPFCMVLGRSGTDDEGYTAEILPDGSFLVGGDIANRPFVVRLTPWGDTLWTWRSPQWAGEIRDFLPLSDGTIAGIGNAGTELFVVRFTVSGTVLLHHRLDCQQGGNPSACSGWGVQALLPTPDQVVILTQAVPTNPGLPDYGVLRVDTTFQTIQNYTIIGHDIDFDFPQDFLRLPDGNIIVAGTYGSSQPPVGFLLRLDGTSFSILSRYYIDAVSGMVELYGLAPSVQGSGFVAVGWISGGVSGYHVFLVRMNASANQVLWAWRYGNAGNGYEVGYDVYPVLDSPPGYLIAGKTNLAGAGSHDGYQLRVDSQGTLLWARLYGGAGWDEFRNIARFPNGDWLLIGFSSSFGQGDRDIWILRTRPDGTLPGCVCETGQGGNRLISPSLLYPSFSVSTYQRSAGIQTSTLSDQGGSVQKLCP